MGFILAAIAVLIGAPLLATSGQGRRGHYLASALVFFALTFVSYELVSGPSYPTDDLAQKTGQEVIDQYGAPFTATLAAMGFGCLIGAALFRPLPQPMKTCPHCAEHIGIAASVCRFCGRDVPIAQPSEAS